MRKAFAVLAILTAATFFVAHGASASRSAAPAAAGTAASAVSVAQGLSLPIDRVGAFKYQLGTAPGLTIATATATSGFGVQGGTVEFLSPPRTVLTDTPAGLVVGVVFNVASVSGSPSLVVHGATVTPR